MIFFVIMLFCWGLFMASFIHDRTRYMNCYLLFIAVCSVLVFILNISETYTHQIMMVEGYLIGISLLAVPYFLIHNGYVMIKKEGKSMAHLLSLLLGIVVLLGELAFSANLIADMYTYGYEDFIALHHSFFYIFSMCAGVSVVYFSVTVLAFVWYLLFLQVFPKSRKCSHIIILGAGLIDGYKVSKLLGGRIDAAIDIYHNSSNKPKIIPSGGKGSDEKISEAAAMKNYLLEKGIPEEDIVLEDESATTYENIINSKRILDSYEGEKNVIVVSSNYHVYRALKIAKKAGLKCTGAGGHVAFYYWPSAVIREYAAIHSNKKQMVLFVLGWIAAVALVLCYFF